MSVAHILTGIAGDLNFSEIFNAATSEALDTPEITSKWSGVKIFN